MKKIKHEGEKQRSWVTSLEQLGREASLRIALDDEEKPAILRSGPGHSRHREQQRIQGANLSVLEERKDSQGGWCVMNEEGCGTRGAQKERQLCWRESAWVDCTSDYLLCRYNLGCLDKGPFRTATAAAPIAWFGPYSGYQFRSS